MTTSRRASLQHPLGKDASIPKKFDPDRLAYLTARIREGTISQSDREELGRGFIRLALSIAAGYASRRPDKGDDYASAALFGIVYALDKAREKLHDDNIVPWVVSNIRRFIRRFYETDHLVHTPASTYHLKKTKGEELRTTSVITMDDREINAGANNRKASTYHRIKPATVGGLYAFKELLSMSAADDRDREILKQRSEGYTDAEIALKMGYSIAFVNKRRAEMEIRFDRLND